MPKNITPQNNSETSVASTAPLQPLFSEKLAAHFQFLYSAQVANEAVPRLNALIQAYFPEKAGVLQKQRYRPHHPEWTEKDTLLITYADMIRPNGPKKGATSIHHNSPLRHLHKFLSERLTDRISTVHLLPFFPSSSDDGFSVIDYKIMDSEMGRWEDLMQMSEDFRIMGDLVMNHVSQHSQWFQGYLSGNQRYREYFLAMDPNTDLCSVVRPRSHPLLTPFNTSEGESWIWTTFSEDQVDVNYANPEVLFEYIDTLLFYLSKGVTMVRMDAVAFIWKEPGTSCLHHPKTHEIVKLIRTLTDAVAPGTTLITETNVPHEENISYFGDGDEAHMVYQFSLAPLLLHALRTGSSRILHGWLKGVSNLPDHALVLNFTASHDGIGVRPVEGLVPEEEVNQLIADVEQLGGFLSSKRNSDGSLSPYELNITYFDSLGVIGETEDDDGSSGLQTVQIARFLGSQAMVLSLRGVPALYFQSLIAGKNDLEGVKQTGRYRSINRKRWTPEELEETLSHPDRAGSRVFDALSHLLEVRRQIPEFHPRGEQQVITLGDAFVSWVRTSPCGQSRIWVVANLTGQNRTFRLPEAESGFVLGISSAKSEPSGDVSSEEAPALMDAISGEVLFENGQGRAHPYQVMWLQLPTDCDKT